jgi:ATP-binding protein involved in chromosome partitioning
LVDPRISVIDGRLRGVKDVVVVSSGKGGVGKSLTASVLALTLSRRGYKVGLLDLDFTSPSTHLILGVRGTNLREEKGIIPAEVFGLRYMSIVYYTRDRSTSLRGEDLSNILIELLAVTVWGELDFLILDMPPGIGDTTLDVIKYVNRSRFLLVATPSILAFSTVHKLVDLLKSQNISIIGILENMGRGDAALAKHVEDIGVKYLGTISFDDQVEGSMGNVDRLCDTEFASSIEKLVLPSILSTMSKEL